MARFWRFFFFNDTATTEIYTLSLHDALPISGRAGGGNGKPCNPLSRALRRPLGASGGGMAHARRSEEHTSELQSHSDLVCRLLLVKKKLTEHGHHAFEPVATLRTGGSVSPAH